PLAGDAGVVARGLELGGTSVVASAAGSAAPAVEAGRASESVFTAGVVSGLRSGSPSEAELLFASMLIVPAKEGGSASVASTLPSIIIVGDTNRDGTWTDDDLAGRDTWTPTRGAFFGVNFDDDNSDGFPDAVRFADSGGTPVDENFVIEN